MRRRRSLGAAEEQEQADDAYEEARAHDSPAISSRARSRPVGPRTLPSITSVSPFTAGSNAAAESEFNHAVPLRATRYGAASAGLTLTRGAASAG